jgi:hypothetical protein
MGGGKQKEYSGGNYSDFDLIRELAVMLKREGVDVKSFASSIRIQRKLDEKSDSQKSPLGLNLLSIFKTMVYVCFVCILPFCDQSSRSYP